MTIIMTVHKLFLNMSNRLIITSTIRENLNKVLRLFYKNENYVADIKVPVDVFINFISNNFKWFENSAIQIYQFGIGYLNLFQNVLTFFRNNQLSFYFYFLKCVNFAGNLLSIICFIFLFISILVFCI